MRRGLRWLVVGLFVIAVSTGAVSFVGLQYALEPGPENVLSRSRPSPEAYNLWSQSFTQSQAQRLLQSSTGREELSPANGAVKVDRSVLELGRRSFYKETFGNEVFLTDVVGILDGPLRANNVTKAILALRGGWTTNLKVEVPETVRIGDRTFEKGSYFDTGLDVPRGAAVPLGMAMSVSKWRVRAGITCALCHATVDAESGKVIEGAPNQDFNAGLLLALATNSAAYFMHTDVAPLRDVAVDPSRTVIDSNGAREPLPAVGALENAVDSALLMWPRGNFDSLTDLKADPTQNPVSFTWGNHPYGWSGNFMAGPFRGLSSQNNNVHALNSDSLLLADSSRTLFDMDKEMYLAILLQNAADNRLRFQPSRPQRPSEFLAASNGQKSGPGLNQVVLPPTYPKGTMISPDGTLTSAPGYHVWEQNNAMAAWQNTIVPPSARVNTDMATKESGRQIFERAGCAGCHAGPFLTNHSIVASDEIGTNSVRALALAKTQFNFTDPVLYTFDTPVPLPPHPKAIPVPTDGLDPAQVNLAWARDGSGGGYKVPSLVGLFWSAPYLHDGGIAVGEDPNNDLGVPGTVQINRMPDPFNSLKALIDRDLRSRVIAANESSPALRRMNVQGAGHNYWVDSESGYTNDQQRALIQFLLSYEPGS